MNPKTDYRQGIVRIGDLTIQGTEYLPEGSEVSNMSIKGFRRLLRKKGTKLFACYVNSVDGIKESFGKSSSDPEMNKIIGKYSDVFRSTLPSGLPPKRSVDHEIETDSNAKIPNRRLFKLSPDEFVMNNGR